jgi:methylenetetrahydrofolate--tRNA-(uracil-5-)-methyltransferase
MGEVTIVGGGLAGCEAAWQLADRGVRVRLLEMRPVASTQAHKTDKLAEIVCSNSFKSTLTETASGVLKSEMDTLGCRLLEAAREASVPAGHALAVDRDIFSAAVTRRIEEHPLITLERKRQDDLDLPLPAVIATGPLTAEPLSRKMQEHLSGEHLYFYDAIAPSVDAGSVDEAVGFRASRYGKGGADYLNIPLSVAQYNELIDRVEAADVVTPHQFEESRYFEACLPIEVMVRRGRDTPRFGPLRPRGLVDPRTGKEPFAVVQLRHESASGTLMGLVGFQTRMTYESQRSVIRSLPGFAGVKILRYGSIHRNMFLNLPAVCDPYLRDRKAKGLFYAGQICGVEGYVECIASGIVVALEVFADLSGRPFPKVPDETMTGALMNHIHTPVDGFQPMNANMGILPPPVARRRGGRRGRYLDSSRRATEAVRAYREEHAWLFQTGEHRRASTP